MRESVGATCRVAQSPWKKEGVPEEIAAMLALAEAIPDVFADAHPELRRVAALVDRTRAAQAVAAPLEFVQEAIMFKHLLHGDGRFDGLEVNER